jgi:hypothetical protein
MRRTTTPEPLADGLEARVERVDRVFCAVAAATDTPQTELPRLVDTLDAEALERLWRSADDTVTLSFQYHGCEVTVHGDGDVDVVPLAD